MRAVYPRFIQMNDNPVNLENDNPIKVLTFKIKVQITPALFNYLTRYDSRPSGVSSRFSFYTNEGFVYILFVIPIPFHGNENFKESLLERVNRIYALLLDGLSYGGEI
jgi:hypothetical protein